MKRMSSKRCECIWRDICEFECPCNHYTPEDYEERLDERDEQRRRYRFMSDWEEYIELYDDEGRYFF